jgi:hypothetical protein
MRRLRWAVLLIAAVAATAALLPGTPVVAEPAVGEPVGTATPSTEAEAPASPGPVAWLSGPFGRAAGLLVPALPPGDPPGEDEGPVVERPLDTVVRSARLALEIDHAGAGVRSWRATARSLADGRVTRLASSGERDDTSRGGAFDGPADPGDFAVTAEIVGQDGSVSAFAWRLSVPDEEAPHGGIPDLVPPALELGWSEGRVEGWLGNGCYVYDCVDVGGPPPPGSLEPARPRAGEPLDLRLADGSPLVSWSAAALSPDGSVVSASSPDGGPFPEGVFPAPPPGPWLLTVEFVLDRDRGWFEAYFLVESRGARGVGDDRRRVPSRIR